MFENAVSDRTLSLIGGIGDVVKGFYLAGGTGLALQLGHRMSDDLDFFSDEAFDVEAIEALIVPDKVVSARPLTLHCLKEGIRLSFLFYDVPLRYTSHLWHGIRVAAWQDIVAEKMKTISQRGAKKDFWDVYAVIQSRSSIQEVGSMFVERFRDIPINRYHVLKSLVYFEDAESDPDPILLSHEDAPDWNQVKRFFVDHIKEFEAALLR
jgi:hypothetical protein